MALTNIFKEPRREITETAIGIAILVPVLLADWVWGKYFSTIVGSPGDLSAALFGMVIGVPILALLSLCFVGIHSLGESACNKIEKAGIQLRPRQRFN